LQEAYEKDSTFCFAAYYLAVAKVHNFEWWDVANWTRKAYRHKDRLPLKYQYMLELQYAKFVSKSYSTMKKYLDLLAGFEFQSRLLLYSMGNSYSGGFDVPSEYEKGRAFFKRIEQLSADWGDPWDFPNFYSEYGYLLHLLGRHEKEAELYSQGLGFAPKDSLILHNRCICAVSRGDSLLAEAYMSEFFSALLPDPNPEAYHARLKGVIYSKAGLTDEAVSYAREAVRLAPDNDWYKYLLAARLNVLEVDFEESKRIIDSLLVIYPEFINFLDLQWKLGSYYLAKEEYAMALDHLERAMKDWGSYHPRLEREILEARTGVARQRNAE
jgi:tetratricopeptide (TPR) repeat protein